MTDQLHHNVKDWRPVWCEECGQAAARAPNERRHAEIDAKQRLQILPTKLLCISATLVLALLALGMP